MILIGIVVPIIIMVLAGIYIYHFIGRILSIIIIDKNYKHKKIINIIATLIILIPALYVFGVWALVVLHLFFISIIVDLIYFFICRISRNQHKIFEKIYKSGIISVMIVTLLLSYGYINMHKVVQTDYTVYTDKSIRSKGYKIAFISDLHFGLNMNGKELKEYCNNIQAQNPDMLVLGGDIVDEKTTLLEMQEAFKILSQVKSTYGTFYVYGNHDKSTYSSKPYFTEEELNEAINDSGIIILADDAFNINDEITITGRKDRSISGDTVRKSADKLAEDTDMNEGQYNILADHQPRELDEVGRAGYDIILSGHTHAGQIWPGGFVIKAFMKDTVCYGHVKNNNMDIIVSSGMAGWGYPLRTEKHCEYVIVDIKNE